MWGATGRYFICQCLERKKYKKRCKEDEWTLTFCTQVHMCKEFLRSSAIRWISQQKLLIQRSGNFDIMKSSLHTEYLITGHIGQTILKQLVFFIFVLFYF